MISIDRDSDHRIKIVRWVDFETQEKVEILIEPHEIPYFLNQLVNHAMTSLSEVANDITRGDCPTCRNTRLVEEENSGGRMWKVACPDCMATKHPEAFVEYPRIGGGVS